MAYLVLLLAVLSRLFPHLVHLTGANVTLVGAGLLFFGSRLTPRQRPLALLAVGLLALSDLWLTTVVYGYPFHVVSYLPTWMYEGAIVLGASAVLFRSRSVLRIAAAAVAAPTGFFLLSNGEVWATSHMYAHSAAGLVQCYVAGLPFYRNDLASTAVFTAVFFALPSAAATLRETARSLSGRGATAA